MTYEEFLAFVIDMVYDLNFEGWEYLTQTQL
jgi:hypothetical protein